MNPSTRAQSAYTARLLPWLYSRATPFLQPDEETTFTRHATHIDGKRVLDLGIGAGRTTAFLAPRAGAYLGIDFSPRMAALAAARYPGAPIAQGDARDLSVFPDATIDFALFSNCGMDSLSPEDRARVFAEVRRVLAPGGRFAFAVHNRGFLPVPPPWALSHLTAATSLPNLAKRAILWPIGIANWLRYRRPPIETEDHAIVHDCGEGLYNYYTLYTTAAAQTRALAQAGLPLVDLIDITGHPTTATAIDTSRAVWFTCIAEKQD